MCDVALALVASFQVLSLYENTPIGDIPLMQCSVFTRILIHTAALVATGRDLRGVSTQFPG